LVNFEKMKQIRSTKKPATRKAASSKRPAQSPSRVVAGHNGRGRAASKKASGTEDIQYVLPLGNGWVIKAAKSATFTAITDTKAEAISIARTIARTKQTQLIVHGKNGAVQMKENYII
jgi:hypothetical protein